uniref:ARM repeat superfamily protein n=1 Tax=Cucumis melo TaxID=3656 RepID=A0A9I9DW95_CUCME
MSNSLQLLHDLCIQFSEPIIKSLSNICDKPSEGSNVSVKPILESLLPRKTSLRISPSEDDIYSSIKDFTLACALVLSSRSSTFDLLSWITEDLALTAESAFRMLSKAYASASCHGFSKNIEELGLDFSLIPEEKRLVVEIIPKVLPLLKDSIKESSIDKSDEVDEVSAASARVPVGFAIVAAHQLGWFITQVGVQWTFMFPIDYPHLGKLCNLVIPCGLTALDHWSPEVKGQGMLSFIHLAKNVNAAELGWYEDVILDACCSNVPSSDEIWPYVVEMIERMVNEMLGHLERQPRNKERRIAWLQHIEPLFHCMGLVLLAHTRRIFPLFFQWMNAEDDETTLLVLQRIQTVVRLTWIRNTPYVERLVDELAMLYEKAATRSSGDAIRKHIVDALMLLQESKGQQFKAAWNKLKDHQNLVSLSTSLTRLDITDCVDC